MATFLPGPLRLRCSWTTSLLRAIGPMLLVSCESTSELRLTPERVQLARVRVLGQLPDLDAASRDMIRTNSPKTAFVSLPFGGAYTFAWTISSNRVATL